MNYCTSDKHPKAVVAFTPTSKHVAFGELCPLCYELKWHEKSLQDDVNYRNWVESKVITLEKITYAFNLDELGSKIHDLGFGDDGLMRHTYDSDIYYNSSDGSFALKTSAKKGKK